MKNNKIETNSGGRYSILGLLGISFVVLKLTGVIDWSWWWVTAPFWGGFVIAILFLFIFILFSIIAILLERK